MIAPIALRSQGQRPGVAAPVAVTSRSGHCHMRVDAVPRRNPHNCLSSLASVTVARVATPTSRSRLRTVSASAPTALPTRASDQRSA